MSLKSRLVGSAKDRATQVQTSMQINPMKWAGIAAGVGFGLGLIGRLLQGRTKRNQPDLIVIETC